MFDISLIGAFWAGLASFITPCVLPLVPPYLCYIGGVSLEQMTADEGPTPQARRAVLISALAFTLGFSTVFMALGATASTLGQFVGENLHILSKIAGAFIILLGLHFLGILRIPLFYREARFEVRNKPAGIAGAYLVGLAFGFGWTPCVGPVLAAILFTAAQQESAAQGAGLLAVYSAGMGLPFLLAAFFMGPFMKVMAKFRRHLGTVEKVIGVMLVLVGLLFLTGNMQEVGYWMQQAFPALSRVG